MNRRRFAAFLPALFAGLPAFARMKPEPAAPQAGAAPDARSAASGKTIESGVFPAFTPPEQFSGHAGHSFIHGMLPTNIGCETHVSYLQPGTPHEPEEKHTHSELWFVREGKVELRLNGISHILGPGDVGIAVAGTLHWIRNAGDTVASYFVVELGSGPITH